MLDSIWGAISGIFDTLKTLASNIVNGLGDFFSALGDLIWQGVGVLHDIFESVGGTLGSIFESVGNTLGGILNSIFGTIGNIFSWLGDFFSSLADFFVHIFVPTESQWQDIKNSYSVLKINIQNKVPFVNDFIVSLDSAKNNVSNEQFLKISMPSFNYNGGAIGVNVNEQNVVNIAEKYEPYRLTVRNSLFLIVVGLAIVFIIKFILNYNNNSNIGGKD